MDAYFCILKQDSERIGRPGKLVEIDDSKFGKSTTTGKIVDGVWVFEGIERESKKFSVFNL